MNHSSSSPDVTQRAGEEGTIGSDSGDSATNTSPQIPTTSLPTVSDMPVSMEDDQPPEQPLESPIQGNRDAANPRTLLSSMKLLIPMIPSRTRSRAPRRLEDKIKETKEIVGEVGGPSGSESLKAQDAEAKAFELSGKTGEEKHNKNVDDLNELGGEEMKGLKLGEERNKNVDDLKDNSVAVPQEIGAEANLTTNTDQPLQSSIQGSDEAAKPRTRFDLNLNMPPCREDEDVAHQITLPKDIADYPFKKRRYPSADCSATDDCIMNSVEDNADPGQLEDKTKDIVGEEGGPPESESLEAQDAEAEASELSGKTGRRQQEC